MPQTSTIAFALLIGFVVFITVRGELPAYLSIVTGSGSAATPKAGDGVTAKPVSSPIGTLNLSSVLV